MAAKTNFHVKSVTENIISNEIPEQNETDDCSPFCICACCQTTVSHSRFFLPITNQVTQTIAHKPYIFHQNPDEKNYQNSIWQPPKSIA
jgi:hypothetical protein